MGFFNIGLNTMSEEKALQFRGQLLQDKWVYEHYRRHVDLSDYCGYFVDIGCNDGVKINNTLLFESDFGWEGVCVDADRRMIELARQNRKCQVVEAVVYQETGMEVCFEESDESLLSGVSSVGGQLRTTASLIDILEAVGAPKNIDYITLDVEGVEDKILDGFSDSDYEVNCWTIEHNGDGARASFILNWLAERDYLVKLVHWDFFAIKEGFVLNGFN